MLNVLRDKVIGKNIVCKDNYTVDITRNNAEIFLFSYSLIYVSSTLIVPYGFYYMPFMKKIV